MVLFLSMDDSVRNRSVPNRTMGFRKSFHREGTEVGEYTIREVHHMYAIIKTGGKQYRVQEGDVLNVEKLDAEKDAEVVFDEVLAIVNDGEVTVGKPVVEGAKVTATVVEQGKADKILVFKYRAKSNYRKRAGHRQPFTTVKISGIQA
jgi:large subunit ribosomal protein L21